MLDRLHACALAPFDLRLIDRQLQFRPAPEQGLQRARSLDTRELMAEAKVNSGAEGQMPVRPALEIELLGSFVCLRIEVCGRQHGHDLETLFQPDAAKLDVLADQARFGELYGRDEPQKFLYRQTNPRPILFEPIAQRRIFQKLINRAANEVSGGLVPREQQQEQHRHHFVTADVSAFLFKADKLGDQTLAAFLAYGFPLPFHVALNREDIRDHAQEADGAREAREAACPGGKLWPVGKGQAEKLANHRKREPARITVDEVGWTALFEQLPGELVGDRQDAGLHFEDGAAAKSLVDNVSQPSMIRLVPPQHIIC